MRSERENGGPAFPIPCQDDRDCVPRFEAGMGGMSLRDYFAAKAMQGDWASQSLDTGYWPNDIGDSVMEARASVYYRMADAMLAARERS